MTLTGECVPIAALRQDVDAYTEAYSLVQKLVDWHVKEMALHEAPPERMEHHFFDRVQRDFHDASISHITAFLKALVGGRWKIYGRLGADILGQYFAEFMGQCRDEAAKEMRRREDEKLVEREAAMKAEHERRKATDPEYAAYWSPEAIAQRNREHIRELEAHKEQRESSHIGNLLKPAKRERPAMGDPNQDLSYFRTLAQRNEHEPIAD